MKFLRFFSFSLLMASSVVCMDRDMQEKLLKESRKQTKLLRQILKSLNQDQKVDISSTPHPRNITLAPLYHSAVITKIKDQEKKTSESSSDK